MRHLFLGALLLPAVAIAEPVTVEKPVLCENTKILIETLSNGKYKEIPAWVGNDDSSKYSIFANEKTGSWTFIQFNSTIACILGTGENHNFVRKTKV